MSLETPADRRLAPVLVHLWGGDWDVTLWTYGATREVRVLDPIVAVDAAELMRPLLWLLQRIGQAGVELTAGDALPPSVVRDAREADVLPCDGTPDQEADWPDLAALRRVCVALGLLAQHGHRLQRTAHGTRLAGDAEALWWHVTSHLPCDEQGLAAEQGCVELLDLLLPHQPAELVPRGHLPAPPTPRQVHNHRLSSALRRRTTQDGRRITDPGITRTGQLLGILGLATQWSPHHGPERYAGRIPRPEAIRAFARAALTRPALPVPDPTIVGPATALRVTLLGTQPPVWRLVHVPADITLERLHPVLGGAMGWAGVHLHMFTTSGGRRFGPGDDDWDDRRIAETGVTLADIASPGDQLQYLYDFGDRWDHLVEVLGPVDDPQARTPLCVAGSGACPPEDVGGIPGYTDLLAALAAGRPAPHQVEQADRVPRDHDPAAFDVVAANQRIGVMLSDDPAGRLALWVEGR